MPTLYEVLGLERRASSDEVRSAYRSMAREFHPDLNPDPAATERMALINEAFEVLSDPVRRNEYDSTLGIYSPHEPDSGYVRRPTAVRTRLLFRHRTHSTPVYGVAFRPDGRMMTSSFDNEVIEWEADYSRVRSKTRLENGVVSHLQPIDGGFVACGTTEQSLSFWRQTDGKPKFWRHSPREWAVCTAVSPDAKWVALGTIGKDGFLLETERGRVTNLLRGHKESITSVAFSPNSRLVATGSADATVRLWNTSGGSERLRIDQLRSSVSAIAFSPDGSRLAVAAVDLSIRIFDAVNGRLLTTFFGHERPVEALAFHPRQWLMGSASRDGTVGLWNVERGVGHGRIEASHQPVLALGFAPVGSTLVCGGLDKVLRVWRLGS